MALADSFSEFEVSTRHLLAGLEHHVTSRLGEMSTSVARELTRAERAVSERFNQTARRLRLAETPGEWRTILAETARHFAGKAEIFLAAELDLEHAPAFATAIESKDTVVTLRDVSQLSEAVTEALGPALSPRCYLIPILHDEQTVAVIYAESSGPVDRHAMELLAALAAQTMPRVETPVVEVLEPEPPAKPQLIQIAGIAPAAKPVTEPLAPPPAAEPVMPDPDRALHLKARRFAKVQVARILLGQNEAVKTGRQVSKLYVYLKDTIDSGRQEFQTIYLEPCASMADYYHEELVRILAHDDATQLGTEYPGSLR